MNFNLKMLKVTDLFCGMGGFSLGFSKSFDVTGYDINNHVPEIYRKNHIGLGIVHDLTDSDFQTDADIVIGGPPCKPWSTINLRKRKTKHPDYILLEKYFKIISNIDPDAFLMENVTSIKNDELYQTEIHKIKKRYSVENIVVNYNEYGAATKRKRLITAGFKDIDVGKFIQKLPEARKKPKTVWKAIGKFQKKEKYSVPDHEWPNLTTISKYQKYYDTGKYGWYKLSFNEPAPSFGNVMKTYTLHPKAGIDGFPLRVVSVREVMAIMGFTQRFSFPKEMGHTIKYQMIADVVSPKFSKACAEVMLDLLS